MKMQNYRSVLCLENGKVYNGYSQAAKELGLNAQCVYKCCVQEYLQTQGYHFCYEDERDIYEVQVSRREKPIIAINLKSGDIKRYSSEKEASKELGLYQQTICRILKEKTKRPRIGYLFKYAV